MDRSHQSRITLVVMAVMLALRATISPPMCVTNATDTNTGQTYPATYRPDWLAATPESWLNFPERYYFGNDLLRVGPNPNAVEGPVHWPEGTWRIKQGWFIAPGQGKLEVAATDINGEGDVAGDVAGRADVPENFCASVIDLPKLGCWKITGTTDETSVRIVVLVVNGSP